MRTCFIIRWKGSEIARFRDKFPLAVLSKQLASAEPARDFKGALLRRAAETGVRTRAYSC